MLTGAVVLSALLILPDLQPQRTRSGQSGTSQLTTSQITVKVVAVDHDAQTVTLLCPMVHRVEIVGELRNRTNEVVRLQPGEFFKAKLVPGRMNTTKRSLIVIEPDERRAERIEVVIQQVVLQ